MIPGWEECPEAFPPDWAERIKGIDRPVIRMKKALYGHPDAGTFWEWHCDSKLRKVGFRKVDCWDSTYWNEELDLLITVYVDDMVLRRGHAIRHPVRSAWDESPSCTKGS